MVAARVCRRIAAFLVAAAIISSWQWNSSTDIASAIDDIALVDTRPARVVPTETQPEEHAINLDGDETLSHALDDEAPQEGQTPKDVKDDDDDDKGDEQTLEDDDDVDDQEQKDKNVDTALSTPVAQRKLSTWSKDTDGLTQAEMDSLFSVQGLQCAEGLTVPSEVVIKMKGAERADATVTGKNYSGMNWTWDPKQKHILFVAEKLMGTSKLRARMMAAAVNAIPGWTAYYVEGSMYMMEFNPQFRVDICIFVKHGHASARRWCERNAKDIIWDLLDNKVVLNDHLQNKTLGEEVTAVLATNHWLARHISTHNPVVESGHFAGMPKGLTLYHQHTNPGFVGPLHRLEVDIICRVAIFTSDKYHAPKSEAIRNMQRLACSVPEVWSFATFRQKNGTHTNPTGDNGVMIPFMCPNRSAAMAETCSKLDQEVEDNPHPPVEGRGCFANQVVYHSDSAFSKVDVIIIVAESGGLKVSHRPATRLLHMMSHGIPTIFWSGFAYMEIAEEGGYKLPSGAIPALWSSHWEHLPSHLKEMLPGRVRQHLRRQGLHMAAKYSVRNIAKQLVSYYEHPPTA